MARLEGVDPTKVGLLTRLAFWFARREVRKITGLAILPEPMRIGAHHFRLFRATASMELGQAAAKTLPDRLKTLASIRSAMAIGCPF